MSLRTNLAVAFVALPAMVAAMLIVEDHEATNVTKRSPRSAIAAAAPPRSIESWRPTAVPDVLQPDEAAAIAYAAMRDDIDPKPRLQLIDAWARTAPARAPLDLLSVAMVDPDETVRVRAQELFDRRIDEHRTASRTDR